MPYSSVFRPDLFAGQTIMVTGGGSGIGRCLAHELVSLGAQVVILGRRIEKLDTVAAEIRADGGDVATQACDIREEDSVVAAIEATLSRFGRIDGLVNNAGGQFRTAMRTISTRGFEAVLRNNLTGGFIFMREVFNRWMGDNGGAIVNMVADMWNGWPDFAHSGAARGGMWTLTQSAACEWAAHGVRVNAVAPGGIASSGFDTYAPEIRHKLFEYTRRVPQQRFGTEAEVSAAIVYLLSPAAAYITGSCIRVDGGAPNARQTWTLAESDRNLPYEGFHRATMPDVLRRGPGGGQ
jgi:citronellol/citronellal dehydrogenase